MKTKTTRTGLKRCSNRLTLPSARRACESSLDVQVAPPLGKLKRILVPIDFSQPSLKAFRYAVPFAEQFGATLGLVHVIEKASFLNDVNNVVLAKADAEQAKEARQRLVKLAQKEIEELIPITPQIRIGRPFAEIVKVAKDWKADLIVISTHGHTGLKRVILGSTAEAVVRGAPCPVLVVRENEREFA